jgi:hypothetical protein
MLAANKAKNWCLGIRPEALFCKMYQRGVGRLKQARVNAVANCRDAIQGVAHTRESGLNIIRDCDVVVCNSARDMRSLTQDVRVKNNGGRPTNAASKLRYIEFHLMDVNEARLYFLAYR